ncbi:MAG: DMT family transporter [Nitrospirae bacterium]|nr:DMT family transporter [Nitrospirota bacterium]
MPQLAILLCTLVWGATFPATKAVLDQIPPFSFLFVRFLLGTVLAVGIALAVGRRLSLERSTLRISAVATVYLFLGYALQTVGLRYTTASNSAFITALYVVFVPLFLKRFGGRTWVSAGLAVVGLWFLVEPAVSVNLGDLLTLGCAAAFAAHISCMESYTKRGDPVSFFLWQLVFVTIAMLPAMLIESPASESFAATRVLVVTLVITGVLATGAFAVQIWAQQLLPAHKVALIFSLEPAFAACLAWYFLNEHLDASGWLGSGLIMTAVVLGAMTGGVAVVREPVESSPAA